MTRSAIDLDAAFSNPAQAFASPQAVLADERLDREEKIDILRLWEYDVSEQQVATEEGMPGGREESERLRQILLALETLVDPSELGDSAPTKQRALLRRKA